MNPHLTEDSRSSFQTENCWEGIFNIKGVFLKVKIKKFTNHTRIDFDTFRPGTHWTRYNGHTCGQNSRHLNCLCKEGFIGASCQIGNKTSVD